MTTKKTKGKAITKLKGKTITLVVRTNIAQSKLKRARIESALACEFCLGMTDELLVDRVQVDDHATRR